MTEFTSRVFSQTFGVVGGLLERNSKILLVREVQRKGPDNGKWSHPAGWIEVGEDPIQGVKREVQEESGFFFSPTHVLGVYSLVREDIKTQMRGTPHAIKIVFIGEISDNQEGELHEDVSEVKWFTPEEIFAMDNNTLRDIDIKQMVKDHLSGQRFPLSILKHTISPEH